MEPTNRTIRFQPTVSARWLHVRSIYAVSGEDVARLDLTGDVVWTSPQLAIDGMRLELIDDESISGEAEHARPETGVPSGSV